IERHDDVGGRAGLWRQDGFAFDTGPSWYLMPEVFDHFFRLMGTTTSDELGLVRLDPAYRGYGERAPGSPTSRIDVRSGTREATALFEQREPGAGRALERYLRSATRAYHAAREAFLYNTFASPRSLLSAAVWRGAPAVLPLLIRSLWSHIRRRFRDGRLRQILGYPAV